MPNAKKPASLYARYMAAAKARTAHLTACHHCTPARTGCRLGEQLLAEFAEVQDRYLAAQKRRP
ncbi:hypothetical protein OG711_38545 (plasmid) [Streptomyces uncialis]|uniref:hypothetical protein n=1 Tax=Streptomyces uncialis TaxID=1048205 RepID=UPI002E323AD4|nr:hypothetical protein [Streptomyces uncialis]